jgi:hypothetical protein
MNILDRRTSENTNLNLFGTSLIPFIKILCSIKVFFRKPLQSITSIPGNFYKYVFVIDLFQSPEVIPGSTEIKETKFVYLNLYNIARTVLGEVLKSFEGRSYFLLDITFGVVIILIFIPMLGFAIAFIFSIKSTALLWLPLLWIIYQSKPGANVVDRIRLNLTLASTKLMLTYSIFVLIGFILKLGLLFEVWKFTQLQWFGPLEVLATRLVAPYALPLWQVTSALNAGLAWAYFFLAQRYLLAQNTTEAPPETRIKREYVAFQVVRTAFSLYAIACTLYIAAATAWQTRWPPIHLILFPRI